MHTDLDPLPPLAVAADSAPAPELLPAAPALVGEHAPIVLGRLAGGPERAHLRPPRPRPHQAVDATRPREADPARVLQERADRAARDQLELVDRRAEMRRRGDQDLLEAKRGAARPELVEQPPQAAHVADEHQRASDPRVEQRGIAEHRLDRAEDPQRRPRSGADGHVGGRELDHGDLGLALAQPQRVEQHGVARPSQPAGHRPLPVALVDRVRGRLGGTIGLDPVELGRSVDHYGEAPVPARHSRLHVAHAAGPYQTRPRRRSGLTDAAAPPTIQRWPA